MWQALTVGLLLPGARVPSPRGGYSFDAEVWLAAAFCGVGATAAAFWCMTWAQRVVPESQAAIILLLEPVSAAVLGALAGEALGLSRRASGAALILASVLVAELAGRSHPAAVGARARRCCMLTTARTPTNLRPVTDPLRPDAAVLHPARPAHPARPRPGSGHACWVELRLHAVLTHWLAVESDPAASTVFWSERPTPPSGPRRGTTACPSCASTPGHVVRRARRPTPSPACSTSSTLLDEPAATERRRRALGRGAARPAARLPRAPGRGRRPADGPTATTPSRGAAVHVRRGRRRPRPGVDRGRDRSRRPPLARGPATEVRVRAQDDRTTMSAR